MRDCKDAWDDQDQQQEETLAADPETSDVTENCSMQTSLSDIEVVLPPKKKAKVSGKFS